MRPIAVLYENEAWMAPLFVALERLEVPHERVFANAQAFDPSASAPDWSLAVNKVSPSSYLRGHAPSIAFARQFLPFLEERGIPVVNGSEAFRLETSKALQLLLLHRLAIRAPAAHVVNDPSRILDPPPPSISARTKSGTIGNAISCECECSSVAPAAAP